MVNSSIACCDDCCTGESCLLASTCLVLAAGNLVRPIGKPDRNLPYVPHDWPGRIVVKCSDRILDLREYFPAGAEFKAIERHPTFPAREADGRYAAWKIQIWFEQNYNRHFWYLHLSELRRQLLRRDE